MTHPGRQNRQTRIDLFRTGAAAMLASLLAACSSGSGGDDQGTGEQDSGTTSAADSGTGTGTDSTGGTASGAEVASGEAIASGLEAPWSIAYVGDTPLISERDSGRILELSANGEAREITRLDDVSAQGESGLHGLAVQDDELFAYYAADGENRIERFAISGDPGSLSLGEPETVLDGLPTANFHNGGRLAFGPDDMLYATLGDTGDRDSAQDREALSGKILRMTTDGDAPEDNPFDDSLVYSYGHRNPQGIAWDSEGTMYASEFGQDTWDELNVIEAGGNYGWPEVEGIAGENGGDSGNSGSGDFIDPVQQWSPDEASPSGMAITEDSIFIANLRGERLREIPLDDLADSTEDWAGEHGRLRDIAVAPDGSLQVLTNNTDGRGDPGDGDDRLLSFDPES
ncbi:PQQ-dependent sugar dehydrogenase [Brevibacterium sp. CCUG 69071]|uniref:PQQ-dependent sugar dehydrogenase n=1 Tax=Brevibacterium sp. CCUG 69071 TaxID=2052937 RepID=UPI001E318510|nr:PQQ-dependent sugar dehydrogenase [Brevibacterium sp. CCUG 69071]